jgi:hypothetical protein
MTDQSPLVIENSKGSPRVPRRDDTEIVNMNNSKNEYQRFKFYSAMKTGFGHLGNPTEYENLPSNDFAPILYKATEIT